MSDEHDGKKADLEVTLQFRQVSRAHADQIVSALAKIGMVMAGACEASGGGMAATHGAYVMSSMTAHPGCACADCKAKYGAASIPDVSPTVRAQAEQAMRDLDLDSEPPSKTSLS